MSTASAAVRPTRDRILDAALDQFGSRGFEASSLDDIATEVGVVGPTTGGRGWPLRALLPEAFSFTGARKRRATSRR